MKNWPQTFFARHGETSWNLEKRYQGSLDIPLNATGQGQADACGPLLVEMLAQNNVDPTKIDWFASPLSRAKETMERIRVAFDTELPPIRFDDRLREVSFGIMEGKLHSELEEDVGVIAGKRDANYWNYRPPKGESYQDVADRLNSFKDELNGDCIIVAHGGVLRVMRHLVENASKEEMANWPPPQGAIAHFRDGSMKMHYT